MNRALKWILALNIAALTVLTFVYPHLMVGPGKLIAGHQKINADCFACHTALTGVNSEKCTACHKPADIGKRTTTGATVLKPLTKTPFHQELNNLDCAACHSDHAGVKRYQVAGRFDHGLLKKTVAEKCQTCHKVPADNLHQQISGNCSQCHTQLHWTPATFDHDKFFVLDNDHNTRCVTCHLRNDYKQYTCYGCHEHTPEKIRREHVEEGIRDFRDCVECHRSADEHGGGGDD
jgi:hypothetical protein